MNTIQQELLEWAIKSVLKFNPLSTKTGIGYYQQSPLNEINDYIDTLILGINPGSPSSSTTLTAEEYLKGNVCWASRFLTTNEGSEISRDWKRYFGGAHLFLSGDNYRHNGSLDNDLKTVWTNFTPFATKRADLLSGKHFNEALNLTLELTNILRPKRIVILSTTGLNRVAKLKTIIREPIVKDKISGKVIEMGEIEGIPTLQLPHPSHQWGMPYYFIPTIVALHSRYAVNGKVPFKIAVQNIKHQLNQWLQRIEII